MTHGHPLEVGGEDLVLVEAAPMAKARNTCLSFPPTVRGEWSIRRASCMVMVEAPGYHLAVGERVAGGARHRPQVDAVVGEATVLCGEDSSDQD